jgi:hypothetical protein
MPVFAQKWENAKLAANDLSTTNGKMRNWLQMIYQQQICHPERPGA